TRRRKGVAWLILLPSSVSRVSAWASKCTTPKAWPRYMPRRMGSVIVWSPPAEIGATPWSVRSPMKRVIMSTLFKRSKGSIGVARDDAGVKRLQGWGVVVHGEMPSDMREVSQARAGWRASQPNSETYQAAAETRLVTRECATLPGKDGFCSDCNFLLGLRQRDMSD